LRWQVMLRPLRPRSRLWPITSATVIGFTAVFLLGRPGELVRPYMIASKEGVPFSSQMAAWLLERILDLLAVLLIFGFALLRFPAAARNVGPGLRWVLETGGYLLGGIGVISVVFLLAFRNYSEGAKARILGALEFLPERRRQRVERVLNSFTQGMECTRDRRNLALLLLYTLIEWGIIVSAYYCLFRAFPSTSALGLVDVLVFLGFVAFGSIVQIPGVGGGIQVAAVVVYTEIFGLPFEMATGMALLIWLLTFALIAPLGLILAFREGLNWRKMRHLPEDLEA
jgi:uncharacterized protein (TIRG00374 family)